MQVRFLLGPAGSGKTSQCLEEVRAALLRSPEGPPLIFLAPKQATFQIERQLLADGRVQGFTRLFILSFERLADFVLDALGVPAPRLLSEEGRLMVLRAIVARKDRAGELQLFRAAARMPGFAQELSKVIRECQRAQVGPEKLRKCATRSAERGTAQPPAGTALGRKLEDIARLYEAYHGWLGKEKLQDADRALDVAAAALKEQSRKFAGNLQAEPFATDLAAPMAPPTIDTAPPRSSAHPVICEALWMDGFAEMTVQETGLLAALLPWCSRATVAFCCEAGAIDAPIRQFSPWSVVAHTANRCLNAITGVAQVEIIPLERRTWKSDGGFSGSQADTSQLELFGSAPARAAAKTSDQVFAATPRFRDNPDLAHLERCWADPLPQDGPPAAVRLVRCASPESEVTFAAREICRHISAGGRYRDVAVLVRQLRGYQDIIRRVFTRYGIPHFLDRREPVAHHPLAELTRYALRAVARGWKQEDLFGVLKSGLIDAKEEDIDWLENEALAGGWSQQRWLAAISMPEDSRAEARLDAARRKLVEPLRQFQESIAGGGACAPTGGDLAGALQSLWQAFDVQGQLEAWTAEASDKAVHTTVWDQMQQWLETMRAAFAGESLRIREWLPIVEAGLAGLSVGVIPPLLDEVLVGSVDRSRNPDLKLALVLGVNEGVFPALPPFPPLLTESDRMEIEREIWLGPGTRQQLAHERFYGYIAFTRAREKLFVTWADTDRKGGKLNPSLFVGHLQRLFPGHLAEEFQQDDAGDVVHTSELAVPLIRVGWQNTGHDEKVLPPAAAALAARYGQLPRPLTGPERRISGEAVEKLFPPTLVTSISRLEEFASCSFQFFIKVGLRAEERLRFEVDSRHTGTFQHEILKEFHEAIRAQGRRWRDVPPQEARALVAGIATAKLSEFKDGLLVSSPRDRIESENIIAALQDFIETVIEWSRQYQFEPFAVELRFGEGGTLPAWVLPLDGGRKLAFSGTIDRVDALIDPARRQAHLVVIDYKSSGRTVDPKLLAAGVQMQLFAYLTALCRLPESAGLLEVQSVSPAGVFYVTLRPSYDQAHFRDEALANTTGTRRKAYQHRGRFAAEMLNRFDSSACSGSKGDQFAFNLRKDGGFHANCADPIPAAELGGMLDAVEAQLIRMGNEIFSGDISLNPYRHKGRTPCERCEYKTICRIDPWTHQFRALGRGES